MEGREGIEERWSREENIGREGLLRERRSSDKLGRLGEIEVMLHSYFCYCLPSLIIVVAACRVPGFLLSAID
jgi:hypothetical protein